MKVNLKERFGIFAKKKKNLPPVGLEPTTFDVIYQTRGDGVSSGYPKTEKRVENTTRSGVFLTKFEVFG